MIPRSRYGCIYDVHSRGRPMFVNSTDEKISALGNQNNPVNCLFIIYLPKFLRSFKLLLNLVTVEVLNHFRWDDPVQHCNYSRLVRLHSTTTHIIILHKYQSNLQNLHQKYTKYTTDQKHTKHTKIFNRNIQNVHQKLTNVHHKLTKRTPETCKFTSERYKIYSRNVQNIPQKYTNYAPKIS